MRCGGNCHGFHWCSTPCITDATEYERRALASGRGVASEAPAPAGVDMVLRTLYCSPKCLVDLQEMSHYRLLDHVHHQLAHHLLGLSQQAGHTHTHTPTHTHTEMEDMHRLMAAMDETLCEKAKTIRQLRQENDMYRTGMIDKSLRLRSRERSAPGRRIEEFEITVSSS